MLKNPRTFDYQPLNQGQPGYLRIFSDDREDPVGWVFLIDGDDHDCVIVDMWVEPKYRRQGFGRDMINVLQQTHKRVWTGMSSPEGRALCLSMGFRINKGHYKRDIPKLEWEARYAKGNGRETPKGSGEEGAAG